ncbi:hypothetical protein [Acidithiobacillus ferriphilus]|jgi:hypothetical protein|uniref:hypothetical protein n=1 Tax=Acidithiobacillus ferriphilus TaxID=1689834 RepID=UPI001C06DADA|nr:hypothetical protein [Acidithiobacillus ferriphilus]MBU2852934.1 hypothetical protein [Acidithiobacillus ferriphilus]
MKVRDKLILAGVHNLQEFGYPKVTPANILTDMVYAAFFRSMLVSNLGQGEAAETVINELIAEIDAGSGHRV